MSVHTPFRLEVREPFSTFSDEGAPQHIPFVIDGLLPKASLSVLGGKAKHGKSSMSRCAAVAVAKGLPFLDRQTERGEVLLCSLEDAEPHVDNHLQLLGYDPKTDARIHPVSKLARNIEQTIEALAYFLAHNRDISLVVLDTMAKVLRAKNSGDYDEMLTLCEQLHLLARETGVHIQALAHCKKVQHDDPFDNFLGSVEIRAETDTNVVIYDHFGKRLIKSETRMGVPWDDPLELHAETETVGKTTLVKRFYLGQTLTGMAEQKAETQERNTRETVKARIVTLLKQNGGEMTLASCFDAVSGNRSLKFEAREELMKEKVIELHGVAHSPTNPLRLTLVKNEPTVESKPPSETKSPVDVQREHLTAELRDWKNKQVRYPARDFRSDIARVEQQLAALDAGGSHAIN